MLSHRPFGTGHPYRYDLDQRVPTHPLTGDEYEVRCLADRAVTHVEVVFSDGAIRTATRVEASSLEVAHGPAAAPAPASDDHLGLASTAGTDNSGRVVWVVTATATVDVTYRLLARTGDGAEITTAEFPVRPASWYRSGGELRVTDPGGVATVDQSSVEWLVSSEGPLRVRLALLLRTGDHVAGFGERYHGLDQRGEVLDAVVFEQYKHQGHRTYLPMPYAIVAGPDGSWGFHLRTTRRTWFDVGATTSDRLWVEAEVSTVDPVLDLHLFAGDPATIIRSFLASTGAPPMPPEWIFRPWISGNEWNTQQRVLAEVERSLSEGIPVGAVVIEAWSDESTFVAFRDAKYQIHDDGSPHRLADFEFPPDGAWPDPQGMVNRLHDLGVKVILWQIPLIPTDRGTDGQVGADARALVERELAVREADGTPYRNRGWWFPGALLPDFTNPDAVHWWTAKRRYLVDELGIDGFKTDGGEHAWGHDLRYADGSRGAETNNRFPVLYAEAYRALTDVTFSRAGFTGAAAVPCHWAGDEDSTWDAYRASITAGVTAGLGGVFFWGWDIAGFSGEIPDAELYLRATAMGCFCPIFQYHSEFNHHRVPNRDRTPWNIAERTGSPEVLDIFRRFALLRDELVPYLIEQAARSVASGRPLMRALFVDFPADEEVWQWPRQYLLGDDLLVAPVTAPRARTWRVYLPAGTWEDYFTRSRHTGPTVVERAVPLDEIPVFRRL